MFIDDQAAERPRTQAHGAAADRRYIVDPQDFAIALDIDRIEAGQPSQTLGLGLLAAQCRPKAGILRPQPPQRDPARARDARRPDLVPGAGGVEHPDMMDRAILGIVERRIAASCIEADRRP